MEEVVGSIPTRSTKSTYNLAETLQRYVPLSKSGAELLFETFSQRYERASTLALWSAEGLMLQASRDLARRRDDMSM